MPPVWNRANSRGFRWWFTQYLFAKVPDNDVFNHLPSSRVKPSNWRASYCTSRLLRFGRSLSRTDARAMRCTAGKLHHRRTVAAFGFHKAVGAQFGEHFALNPAFLAPHRLALSRRIRGAVGCLLALDALLLTAGAAFSQSQPPFADAPPVTGWQSDRQGVPAAG
jgi:hypothetical protein